MNATTKKDTAINVTRRDQWWVCYRTNQCFAVELFNARTIEECREWARCAGYGGIMIGSPSRPWAN